ncbi:MAG: DUF1284 domain-containing protein [Clostridia bacterium]|nr:DUF1284 domain-containing protein [Clostridia bacterium]
MSRELIIRGHHLLCMLGFRGEGYNEAFVANMGKVVKQYKGDSGLEITVADHHDDICRACPHLQEKFCRQSDGSDERLAAIDREVLVRLGLKPGQRVTLREIRERIKENIKPSHLAEICQDCRWLPLGFCQEGVRESSVFSRQLLAMGREGSYAK